MPKDGEIFFLRKLRTQYFSFKLYFVCCIVYIGKYLLLVEGAPFCSRRTGRDGADNDTLTRSLNSILASQFAAHFREQFRAFASPGGTDYGREFMRVEVRVETERGTCCIHGVN